MELGIWLLGTDRSAGRHFLSVKLFFGCILFLIRDLLWSEVSPLKNMTVLGSFGRYCRGAFHKGCTNSDLCSTEWVDQCYHNLAHCWGWNFSSAFNRFKMLLSLTAVGGWIFFLLYFLYNLLVCVTFLLWIGVFFFFHLALLGYMVIPCLAFFEEASNFFFLQWLHHFTFPRATHKDSHFST